MLMHAPSCVSNLNPTLAVIDFRVPSCCWEGVGQDTADACVPSDHPLLTERNHQLSTTYVWWS